MSADVSFNQQNVTISSSGSFTGDDLDVLRFKGATILIEGDANSSNLTVTVKAKLDETATNFSHYTDYAEVDLTSYDNNRKVLTPLDVGEVNDMRIEIDNDGGSSTDVSYRIGVS